MSEPDPTSSNREGPTAESRKAGYETSDVSARALLKLGILVVILSIAIHVSIALIQFRWTESVPGQTQPKSGLAPLAQNPPPPQLQVNPQVDLKDLQSRHEKQLNTYGWVDRKAGLARVPIARAMELLEQGRRPQSVAQADSGSPGLPAQQTLPQLTDVGFDQKLGSRLPLDVEFTDELGRKVPLRSLLDRNPVVLSFAYFRCPGLCTLVLNGTVEALKELPLTLGKDYRVITIGINPKEGPKLALAKKRSYLARYERLPVRDEEPGWRFLTGDEASIRKLASQAGFRYRFDPETGEYSHPSGLIVLTPDGTTSRYLLGIQYSPSDLQSALKDASFSRIGQVIQSVTLFCFRYDPRSGKYGVLITVTLKILAVCTVFGLILMMIWPSPRKATPLSRQEKP